MGVTAPSSSGGPTISLSSEDSLGGTPPLLHNVPLPLNSSSTTATTAPPPTVVPSLPNGPLSLHCGAGSMVVTCSGTSADSSSASASTSAVVIPAHEAARLQLASQQSRAPGSPAHSSSAGSTTICEADVHHVEDEKKGEAFW